MRLFYFFVNYKDGLNVYKTYFESNGGFIQALGIALGIAFIVALLVYLIVGFTSFKLSKTSTWIAALVTAMVLAFVITLFNTGMDSKSRGLGQTLEQRWKKCGFDEEKKPVYEGLKKDFRKGIAKAVPVRSLCIGNCIYTGVFFYLFSLIFLTILPERNYMKNTPHRLGK